MWAQDLSWSPGGANSGGTGTWNAANTNWFNGSTIVPWVGGNTAVFGGAAGAVTVSGTVSVGGATFNTDGYTLTGGTLALSGATTTFTANAGVSATIDSAITGSATLVKSGAGTLTFSTAKTYTGATTVDAGRLVLNNASGFVSATTVNSGATLAFTGTTNVSTTAAVTLKDGATLENINSSGWTVLSGAVNSTGNTSINVNHTGSPGLGLYLDGGLKGSGTVTINAVQAGDAVKLRNNNSAFSGTLIINGIANATAGAGSGVALGGAATSNVLINTNVVLNGTIELADQGFGSGFSTSRFNLGALSGTGIIVANRASNGNFGSTLVLGNTNDSGVFSGRIMRGTGITNVVGVTKVGTGTQVLSGANTYTGATTINGGVLSVSNIANGGAVSNIGASSSAAANLVFGGGTLQYTGAGSSTDRRFTLGLPGGTIDASGSGALNFANTAAVTLSGAGARSLTLTGSNTDANTLAAALGDSGGATSLMKTGTGTWVLTAANSYTGSTTVSGGTLRAGATNTFSAASAHNVLAGGTLDLNGLNQTVASLDNAGTVRTGGAPGTTLTVAGNYVGSGGVLAIMSVVAGDASATDRLVVAGNTSGNTFVKVTNVGGAGAPTVEGIKVVDVGGTSNGTFTLQGDYAINGQQAIVAGAYAYTLQKNGVSTPADGDWYLRSSVRPSSAPDTPDAPAAALPGPLYQPGVPLYESYGQILLGMNGLSTFRQRIGDRYSGAGDVAAPTSVEAPSPVWARVEGQHTKMTPSTTSGSTYTADQMKLQSGFDGLAFANSFGQLIFGMSAHYTTLTSDIKSFYGNGKINVEGAGIGGSLTWLGEDGFYVDGQSQVTWYKSDLSSDLAGTVAGNKLGYGYAVGAEGGRRIPLGGGFSLTPQAQLVYSSVNFDSFSDRFGALVSNDRARSLLGRAGLSLDHQRVAQGDDGQAVRSDIYGIANVYYEFLNGTVVDVAGTKFASNTDRLWGGVGVGGNYRWADDKYAVYGEVSFNTSLADAGDNYAYKGTVGFRAKW